MLDISIDRVLKDEIKRGKRFDAELKRIVVQAS